MFHLVAQKPLPQLRATLVVLTSQKKVSMSKQRNMALERVIGAPGAWGVGARHPARGHPGQVMREVTPSLALFVLAK